MVRTSGLDGMKESKFLILPGLELRLLVIQPVASRYIDYATSAHIHGYMDSEQCSVYYPNELMTNLVRLLGLLSTKTL
jgi:hypothetical protein